MNRLLHLVPTALVALTAGIVGAQSSGSAPERWHFEGHFSALTMPIGADEDCGERNAFLDSAGYFYLKSNSVTLEGLGCTIPVSNGTDTSLYPCDKSDQMEAWLASADKELFPAVSFRPLELNQETGEFRLAGEAVQDGQKICFETTGTAKLAEE